jgi:hypothetical protein
MNNAFMAAMGKLARCAQSNKNTTIFPDEAAAICSVLFAAIGGAYEQNADEAPAPGPGEEPSVSDSFGSDASCPQ